MPFRGHWGCVLPLVPTLTQHRTIERRAADAALRSFRCSEGMRCRSSTTKAPQSPSGALGQSPQHPVSSRKRWGCVLCCLGLRLLALVLRRDEPDGPLGIGLLALELIQKEGRHPSSGVPACVLYGTPNSRAHEPCTFQGLTCRACAEPGCRCGGSAPARVKVVVASFMQPSAEYRCWPNAS